MTGDSRVQPMAATAHTPTPWRFDHDWHRLPTIFGADGYMLAVIQKDRLEQDKANAALIVEAVNNYEALKARNEALEAALRAIQKATVEGRVCDDVAWFDDITTLHDFCESVLTPEAK